MCYSNIINVIGYSLIGLILALTPVVVLSGWLSKRKQSRIRDNGLPLLRLPPVWYSLLKFLLPKNQYIPPVIKLSQWNQGLGLLFEKDRILAIVSANSTFVHLFKPEYIEAVMTSSTMINKPWIYNFIKPLVGEGLLTSAGEKWKARRKLLTPAFHFKILERFMPIYNFHSFTFIRKLERHSENSSYVDVVPMVSLCTLDVIGETAMGVKINSQEEEDSEYVKSIVRLEEFLTERVMFPWYWFDVIYYLTPKGKQCKRALKIVHDFTRRVVSEKKLELKQQLEEREISYEMGDESDNVYTSSKQRMAFLDLLLYRHLTDGSISEEEICEEVDTFMFEGHDTTAMGVSWALYNLGLYPDIQDRAYKETQDIFGNDKERAVTVEDLRKMKYLECVIKESFRLYPPVPVVQRNNPEDTKILGKTIPGKSTYDISIIALHRDPATFPNPEVFDPERFFPENAEGRHPFAYIPFSAGPRNCIGQKFAMMEEKTIITNVLRHFSVESLEPRDKVLHCSEIVLRPLDGVRLKFSKR